MSHSSISRTNGAGGIAAHAESVYKLAKQIGIKAAVEKLATNSSKLFMLDLSLCIQVLSKELENLAPHQINGAEISAETKTSGARFGKPDEKLVVTAKFPIAAGNNKTIEYVIRNSKKHGAFPESSDQGVTQSNKSGLARVTYGAIVSGQITNEGSQRTGKFSPHGYLLNGTCKTPNGVTQKGEFHTNSLVQGGLENGTNTLYNGTITSADGQTFRMVEGEPTQNN